MIRGTAILMLALGGGVVCAAHAQSTPVPVRYGDHPGYGRLVFDLPTGSTAAQAPVVAQIGDTLVVPLASEPSLPASRVMPRNVRNVTAAGNQVSITLAPGVTVRKSWLDGKLVLDVLDQAPPQQGLAVLPANPPISAAGKAAEKPATLAKPTMAKQPTKPVSQPLAREQPPPPAPSMEAPAPVVVDMNLRPTPSATPAAPPSSVKVADAMPHDLTTSAASAPDGQPGHVLALPFAAQVGAAAFRRGSDAVVVFDERRPIDLKPLQDDAVFGAARIQLLPAATVLRLRLPPQTELRLQRTIAGWNVTAIGGDADLPKLHAIQPEYQDSRVVLPAAIPGMVVSIPDSDTGGLLLVGTQRKEGEAVATQRFAPDYTLLPTWQGVLVELLSDAVVLRATGAGFAIGVDGPGRQLVSSRPDPAVASAAGASRMSRIYDFPDLKPEALLRRLQGAEAAAGAAPIQSRTLPRRAVAEAMMALGLGPEAQSVLGLVATTNANAGDDPQLAGLAAVAALLSGREREAGALDDDRLSGSDEIALWRAVRSAMRSAGNADAASVFANTLPLLLAYPQPLRDRILPLASETMAQGGQSTAAATLLELHADDPSLDLARAFVAQAQSGGLLPPTQAGKFAAEALSIYDRLAKSSDRLIRVRAARSGAELRLAIGQATPAQTAETLGKLIYAWRGDDAEVAQRLRIADLLVQSGQGRQALTLLRETEQLWPDQHDAVHGRLVTSIGKVLSPEGEAELSPFDLVALAEENADLLPSGEAGRVLAEQLSDRLIELDLPARAIPALQHLVNTAQPSAARSAFGFRLAALTLQQHDPVAAIAALSASAFDTIPPALLESRTLIFAAAMAAEGDLPSADKALRDIDTLAADEQRAVLNEDAKNWPGAVSAWRAVSSRKVSSDGKLDEEQSRIILRLAGAAAQAQDFSTLNQLRSRELPRLPPGQSADLFSLLTAPPVQRASDLPRAARDITLVQTWPGSMGPSPGRPAKPIATP